MFGKKSSFGIYISGDTLRLVELVKTGGELKVGQYGEHKISGGRLSEILAFLKKKLGLKSAHLSVAGEQADSLQDFISNFNNSGIQIKSFEHPALALSRALLPKDTNGTHMILEFGQTRNNLFVIAGGEVGLVADFDFAGDMLQSKDAIQKHFLNWHLQKENSANRPPIQKIIITGAEHDMEKLSEYLSVSLRHPVEPANVWINILDPQKETPEITLEDSFAFAAPLGLALKEFYD